MENVAGAASTKCEGEQIRCAQGQRARPRALPKTITALPPAGHQLAPKRPAGDEPCSARLKQRSAILTAVYVFVTALLLAEWDPSPISQGLRYLLGNYWGHVQAKRLSGPVVPPFEMRRVPSAVGPLRVSECLDLW